jgi:aristolochene synthase
MGVINDIYSWDREWKVYQENPIDGARPFSAIYILSQETGLPYSACRRMMYHYCRELETVLQQSGDDIRSASAEVTPDMKKYIRGLEYLMSGVETWSRWTPRYKESTA